MRTAVDLLQELNAADESVRIEAKRAIKIGKSVMQSILAFANEPGLDGGYLLLGVDSFVNDKGDTVYQPTGLADPDRVQSDLASKCASMLSVVLRPEMRLEVVDGHVLLVVRVYEVDAIQKPVYLKATGLPKGAYRRVGSTDQQCVDDDLWVLRGESQPLHGPDSCLVTDARLDDFDPNAIAAYRRGRASVNPQAEELAYDDEDLLEALGALRREDGQLRPTLAGIVLFAKSIALRRLLPAIRIDYIRVPGNEWVVDPEHRFQSIDIRKPLLLALPQAEASVIDELPKSFYLPEGQLQSVQEPVLPRKVIREALANAAMHRSYAVHQPTQIIRYGNRIEVLNAGYSLKDTAQLGAPGSRLRNPLIAAVLHDLHLAEAKGTGIRTMRRLSAEAGLPLPELTSNRQANEFRLTLFLHNLLSEEEHEWLKDTVGSDYGQQEAQILTYARATGAVDNAACREVCGLDILSASQLLRRLRDRGLLDKRGAGNRTYYVLGSAAQVAAGRSRKDPFQSEVEIPGPRGAVFQSRGEVPGEAESELPRLGQEVPRFEAEVPRLESGARGLEQPVESLEGSGSLPLELATFLKPRPAMPPPLKDMLDRLGNRPRKVEMQMAILALCRWQPLRADQLGELLKRNDEHLRITYLKPMQREGLLVFRYPESPNHPLQAYVAVEGDTSRSP